MATLWSVSDEEQHRLLMHRFYELRVQEGPGGMAKAEALRRAQVELLRGVSLSPTTKGAPPRDFSHPFFWAPFVLIGNWR